MLPLVLPRRIRFVTVLLVVAALASAGRPTSPPTSGELADLVAGRKWELRPADRPGVLRGEATARGEVPTRRA